MVTVVVFLWRDPRGAYANLYQYGPDHVNRMRSMLERHLLNPHDLVCVTDIPEGIDPRVRIVPLDRSTIGGPHARFPKLRVFAPDAGEVFGRRILVLDLDSVIVGGMGAIAWKPGDLVLWENSSYGKPGRSRYNSSIFALTAGARPDIWAGVESGEHLKHRHDQAWISECAGPNHPHTWNANGSDGIFKARDMKPGPLPEGARIVTFAGKNDPSLESTRRAFPWIAENWR